jgi:bifunctional enzyme CysN/CysC
MNQPVWHEPQVSRASRWSGLGLSGATVWLTGLSGSGKSTIAHAVADRLTGAGTLAYVLDADNLRHGLNADLGFDDPSRRENVRRVAEVAALFADAGAVTLVPIISPFADGRAHARSTHTSAGLPFAEVHVATTLAECERRDTKGLYAKVRSGAMQGVSGVDAPYEAPTAPELVLDAGATSVEDCVEQVVTLIARLRDGAPS